MIIIGICGASGSGKSTLARKLREAIGEENCVILNHDCYYKDHPDLSFEERCGLNYDEPSIFDHDLVLRDVQTLLEGKPVNRKVYNFAEHARNDSDEMIQPPKVLLIEGIHAFFDPRLLELMFLKLYVHVDADVCLLRRVKRDMRDRGRSIESIYSQYLATVKPMFEKYIKNYESLADIIVAHGGKNARVVDLIASYLSGAGEN